MKTDLKEIGFMRIALGLYLLVYYSALSLRLGDYFGPGSMINPDLLGHFTSSPLFAFWDHCSLTVLMIALFGLIFLFIRGKKARLVLPPLFFLHISFHHANPFIIHEPQQLTNLLLLCCFFLPIEGGARSNDVDRKIVCALNLYLGCYYFIAGAKKLSDPLWRSGESLWTLMQWDPARKWGLVPDFFIAHPLLCRLGTWGALAFELSFVFLIFTRARPWIIVAGMIFHLFIYLTLEVGSFSYVMLPWYSLLLNKDTRADFGRLFRQARRRISA